MMKIHATTPPRILFDEPMRDPSICLAPDGFYYLTGTTGDWWTGNDGIRVWRSPDLQSWEALGLVWELEKQGTWHREGGPQLVWATEIHFLRGTFWLTYSMPRAENVGRCGLLKSLSGEAVGPYCDVADTPLSTHIDASLFEDDDGSVYWVYQDGRIARMKEDMTGLAETPRLLAPSNYRRVGHEGAFLAKIEGRYHLICAEWMRPDGTPVEWREAHQNIETYDYGCMAASSDQLFGPYGPRNLALPHAGHNTLFKDKTGGWWSTFFGNSSRAPFKECPAILQIEVGPDDGGRP